MAVEPEGYLRFSVSLVTQGDHRFYTLTMPSDVLARTSFVVNRDEDPILGFQRHLERRRAEEIATYIDNGLGTIPNSIILSAQSAADLTIIGRGKTIQFKDTNRAFLILDGQHRVFGFSLAKTALRVPVVIYNGLSLRDETRLFIDINTKQRQVPSELLLAIRQQAEYQDDTETIVGDIFDLFLHDRESSISGLLAPHKAIAGKLSRVTFNAGVKQLIQFFPTPEANGIFTVLNSYLIAVVYYLARENRTDEIANKIFFRAIMKIFPNVLLITQSRYGRDYAPDHFIDTMAPLFSKFRPAHILKAKGSYIKLADQLADFLKADLTI